MSNMRVATTEVLLHLIDNGVKYRFNRQLDRKHLEPDLDPNGFHVLFMELAFHEQATPNVDHHRTSAYMKMRDDDKPLVIGSLDVSDSDWNQLSTVQEVESQR